MNLFIKTLAAIFSSTQGRTSSTACVEDGSSTAGVARDILRSIDSLLVRAHQPDNLPSHMQESPPVGISHQTGHQKQVQTLTYLLLTPLTYTPTYPSCSLNLVFFSFLFSFLFVACAWCLLPQDSHGYSQNRLI